MAREIKFRAWDKDHNKMLTEIHQIWRLDRNTVLNSKEGGHHNLRLGWLDGGKIGYWRDIMPEQIELMQFTGLHDKNGKEIYEGDIVKVRIDENIPNPFEIFEIVWQENRMRLGLRSAKESLEDSWAFTPQNDFEVIGNVFENPELTK